MNITKKDGKDIKKIVSDALDGAVEQLTAKLEKRIVEDLACGILSDGMVYVWDVNSDKEWINVELGDLVDKYDRNRDDASKLIAVFEAEIKKLKSRQEIVPQ